MTTTYQGYALPDGTSSPNHTVWHAPVEQIIDDIIELQADRFLALAESGVSLVTNGGHTAQILIGAIFTATANPVRMSLLGGQFASSASTTVLFELYDEVTDKVYSSALLTCSAGVAQALPALRVVKYLTAGENSIFLRVTPTANSTVTLAATDDAPVQLLVEEIR